MVSASLRMRPAKTSWSWLGRTGRESEERSAASAQRASAMEPERGSESCLVEGGASLARIAKGIWTFLVSAVSAWPRSRVLLAEEAVRAGRMEVWGMAPETVPAALPSAFSTSPSSSRFSTHCATTSSDTPSCPSLSLSSRVPPAGDDAQAAAAAGGGGGAECACWTCALNAAISASMQSTVSWNARRNATANFANVVPSCLPRPRTLTSTPAQNPHLRCTENRCSSFTSLSGLQDVMRHGSRVPQWASNQGIRSSVTGSEDVGSGTQSWR
mmetsp:Transcript_62676/g.147434  ORF Transcript_62676/g.147434 Transcript_62676/m.147434 type:complete len:271 (-) Transcript_62676:1010-1822(-)